MKQNLFIPVLNLQLFADGGAATGGAGEGGQGQGVTVEAAAPQSKGVKNPLAGVKYGIQEEAAPVAEVPKEEPTQPPDRKAEFEKLIKGEYKEEYDQRMQDTIRQRLKGSKETADKLAAITPALEILAQKYGVDPADMAALSKAIENDDSFYSDEALKKGMKTEDVKTMRKMERDNVRLQQQVAEQQRKAQADQQYAQWAQQAQQAKQLYPGLDMQAEIKNPQFMQLLKAGVDVGSAYLVIHKDDILPAAMQHTAKVVEQKLADKIIAGGTRPAENGMSSQSAAVTKSDVSALTKADRDEIRRRVARGERIRF